MVQRRPPDPMDSMTRGSNPVRSTRHICESFQSQNVVLTRCRCAPPTPVCIRTLKNVRQLKILWSMSEFGGLWKDGMWLLKWRRNDNRSHTPPHPMEERRKKRRCATCSSTSYLNETCVSKDISKLWSAEMWESSGGHSNCPSFICL